MKISLDKVIAGTWRTFSSNIVLIFPPIAIGILNLLVYLFLAASLLIMFAREFLRTGLSLVSSQMMSAPDILSFFVHSAVNLFGIFLIFLFYNIAINVIHGAGYSNMYSRAVSTGRTGIADYFEGIAMFSGRMFWMYTLRTSLIWIPPLILLVTAAVTAIYSGESSVGYAGIMSLVILSGFAFVILVEVAICFFTWMWRPAMFTGNIPVMDALFESISFAGKNPLVLLIIAVLWFCVMIAVGLAFGILNMLIQLFTMNPDESITIITIAAILISGSARWIVTLVSKIILTVLFYKCYFDVTFQTQKPLSPAGPGYNAMSHSTFHAGAGESSATDNPADPFRGLPPPWEPPARENNMEGSADSPVNDNTTENDSLPPGFC